LQRQHILGLNDFPVKFQKTELNGLKEDVEDLKNNEIRMIRKALQNCKYNQKVTAEVLGITRDTLIRKMKKYNITIRRGEEE
jgi:DNA-binding NtrC family response regulator